MNEELNAKLNILLDNIKASLVDIKKSGKKAVELKKAVRESKDIVVSVLDQQLGGASLEQQINISALSDDDWLVTVRHIISEINDPFVPKNQYEIYFSKLIDYLRTTDIDTLVSNMKYSLNKFRQDLPENYETFLESFETFTFWGKLDPDNEEFDAFEQRAKMLKYHSYDLLWLYRKTGDYISKRTLAAVLMNWADLQTEALAATRSIFREYCEPDIIPENKDDIFVDIGSFKGDTIQNYTTVYGQGYNMIYSYDIVRDSCDEVSFYADKVFLHDIDIRNKGVGAVKGKMYVLENDYEPTLSRLVSKGDKENRIDVVRIDDDVENTPTFIKINAVGSEQDILSGCKKTIRKSHPKLAVAVYYRYDDIWKIPAMIEEMYPDYRFYIRHYGGDMTATGVVLFCV